MSEVKFEPLFGDQSVFHKDDKESVVAIGYSLGRSIIKGFSDKYLSTLNRGEQIIAMRRIIKTPVWTVADQKAWRLPEVGAKYIGKNELNPETELICDFVDGDKCVWGHDKNKKMFCFYVSDITAIETTAEKAQLLEDEFVNDVLNKPSRRMTETDRGFYTDGIRAAYRKHLELAAPKGGDKA